MRIVNSFLRNTRGNFAIITAVALGAVSMAAAVAIDASSLYSTRATIQDMSDTASLAAAIAANKRNIQGDPLDRLEAAKASIAAHSLNLDNAVTLGEPQIVFDDVTQQVTITIPATRKLFFSGILNRADSNITAQSSASYEVSEVNPVSLAFVVDVSGSMGWCPSQNLTTPCPADEQPRIVTLQQAAVVLFNQIESGNANIEELQDKIRTGVWTYRSTEGTFTNMADGWNHSLNFINGLTASGGTHSTEAFQSALEALESEARSVTDPNHKRFIVFMTDGQNSNVSSTFDTENFCRDAKEQGINIFSVAFAASLEGENLLLQCASPNDDETVSDPGMFEYNADEERVDNRCDRFTDPSDGESNGRRECERAKTDSYFDAQNEEEFRAAFAKIGAELGKIETRLTQ